MKVIDCNGMITVAGQYNGFFDFGDSGCCYSATPDAKTDTTYFTTCTRGYASNFDVKRATLDFSNIADKMQWCISHTGKRFMGFFHRDFCYQPTTDGGVIRHWTATDSVLKNVTDLGGGKWMYRDFGRFGSGLCVLTDDLSKFLDMPIAKGLDYNVDTDTLKVCRGWFFTSKKGTPCFRTDGKGGHILLVGSWDASYFKGARGSNLPTNGALYSKKASTRGGGQGYDYSIYPYGWRNL